MGRQDRFYADIGHANLSTGARLGLRLPTGRHGSHHSVLAGDRCLRANQDTTLLQEITLEAVVGEHLLHSHLLLCCILLSKAPLLFLLFILSLLLVEDETGALAG